MALCKTSELQPSSRLRRKAIRRVTVTAYENGNQWKEKDVERRLLGYGMTDELVKRLLNRFEIGIGVLHKRKMMEQEAKSTSN